MKLPERVRLVISYEIGKTVPKEAEEVRRASRSAVMKIWK
jgi:hypothetical protein